MLFSQMRLGTIDVVKDDAYLGATRCFNDKDHRDPDDVLPGSGMNIRAVYVKNDSGGALAPGLGATYKAGSTGKLVGALSGANAICHGIIDPYLTASVPNGSYFWLIIEGPVNYVTAGTGGLTAGALLQTGASGTFVAGTAGTNPIGHSGYAVAAITATEKGKVYFHNAFAPQIP